MVAHNTGDVNIELAGLPPCQQVVEAVAHTAHEDGHAWTLVAEVEAELHLVASDVERVDQLADLFAGDEERVQLPLEAHEEHAVLTVHILVQIDNVTLIVGYELGYL